MDAITLAYQTLKNPDSREEYDLYISQDQFIQHIDGRDEEDPEVKAERERRRKERGKKRYEENYDYVNEEFFASWQNRTNSKAEASDSKGDSIETMFDGDDLHAEVEITFEQSIQEGGIQKEITLSRSVICSSCNGSREAVGSKSNVCYSCKGTGIKEDSLFKK